ncbi:hypothetical protein KR222_001450 [Zaprionus bogoriensis]|nr:hypothetical protein KR222_001450 [Zaprionus bogoriensis]
MLLKCGIILLLGLALATAELRDVSINGGSPRNCYSCSGINCQRTSRQNATVQCNDLLDVCVSVFEGFRVSERGCLLEISLAGRAKCNAGDKQCLKCNGELCNNLGRSDFQCLQCSGSEVSAWRYTQMRSYLPFLLQNSKCNSAASSLSPAQCGAPTASNAYCYVKVDGEHLQRGCSLSLSEQQSCLKSSDCSLCLPENSGDTGACNTYELNYKSGATTQAQPPYGLLLGVLSLFALRVTQ